MNSPARVDPFTCLKVAKKLRVAHLKDSFYQRPFLVVQADPELRFRAFFYAVAICHQTYQLKQSDLHLYGWDYIEYVFTRLIEEQDDLLKPGYFIQHDEEAFMRKLASLFPSDNSQSTTSLDRLQERTNLLIQLDRYLRDQFQGSIVLLAETASGKLLNNGHGFYEVLEATPAFSDPLRKKSTFLVKLLEEAGLLCITDAEHIIPIMDYHMQRLLIRTGCVEITDMAVREALIQKQPLHDDTELRARCIESMQLIADHSGFPVVKMNDFFWSLGRSCCNEHPLCQAHTCEKNPCTFTEIVELESHQECFLQSCCKGFEDETYRQLWQPLVTTHFY